MSLRELILGKRLRSSEESKERLGVITGVPVLGLDALASTGYGPEAALAILTPLGLSGLHDFPLIVLVVLTELTMLYLSYFQTAAAYPNGGGAYIVAGDNLGVQPALWAAVALLLDYLLNVAVGISAGVGAVVSAIPQLQPYTLTICLVVLLTLTSANLRGVRESGITFVVPVLVFIACVAAVIAIGLVRALEAGGHPHPQVAPPALPEAAHAVTVWFLLAAFANGCTAMTGIEAVSNGVPLFREPKVLRAQTTLTVIFTTLSLFLLGVSYLCPLYHIGALDQRRPGYQTVLSQLIAAVAGRGTFFYFASASLFIVLTYSAQTSFADFPRVCRLLAEDQFLPSFFAERGRRLVYSQGILILTILSALLLVVFRGVTDDLIPLFAVGALTAFVLSQAGMVVHWLRRPGSGVRLRLFLNSLGAATTSVALVIIILAKFTEGAWMTIVAIPGLVLLLNGIKRHYRGVSQQLERIADFRPPRRQPPSVVIPISGWNQATEKALELALLVSDTVIALHVATERSDKDKLKQHWKRRVEKPAGMAGAPMPRLEIVDSPYRLLYRPILDFLDRLRRTDPDRVVAVIIPELVEPHWYEYLLHNLHAARLRAAIYRRRDEHIVVVNTPWYLHDRS
jgi:amino acid transporter